jgi:hypothetical protein
MKAVATMAWLMAVDGYTLVWPACINLLTELHVVDG